MAEDQKKRPPRGIPADEPEAGHWSTCDQESRYFWGTESKEGGVVERVYRCACDLKEERVNITTGEILEEKMA